MSGPPGQAEAERTLRRMWRLAEGLPEATLPPGWEYCLRPGERLAPHAVAVIAAALARAPHAAAAYTDTVRLAAQGGIALIELKPAWDPVLAAATGYDGDLRIERTGARGGGPVLHIPYPALLTPHTPEVRPFAPAPAFPAVSVVIPTRDRPDLIARVLAGVLDGTDYPGLEVIVVDNGSTDPAVRALYAGLAGRIAVIEAPGHFNFSALVNRGARAARGAAILLLNNDVEMRAPGWLAEMTACLALPGTGIVGARLLFPDGTLQHAGVILGLDGGTAGHWYARSAAGERGPGGRLRYRQRLSAVTGACMLVSRACWEGTGGFDESDFAVAYNDVDFCLRAAAAGFTTLWTPYATLVHHEKATRRLRGLAGLGGLRRLHGERAALRRRHAAMIADDPAFSPWFSRRGLVPVFRLPRALPPARFRAPFPDA